MGNNFPISLWPVAMGLASWLELPVKYEGFDMVKGGRGQESLAITA